MEGINKILSVEQWYDQWRLNINVNKTTAIMINRNPKNNSSKEIKLYGKPIKSSNEVKYLGVTLGKTLSFKTHITKKFNTAQAPKANMMSLFRASKLSNETKSSFSLQSFSRRFSMPAQPGPTLLKPQSMPSAGTNQVF